MQVLFQSLENSPECWEVNPSILSYVQFIIDFLKSLIVRFDSITIAKWNDVLQLSSLDLSIRRVLSLVIKTLLGNKVKSRLNRLKIKDTKSLKAFKQGHLHIADLLHFSVLP